MAQGMEPALTKCGCAGETTRQMVEREEGVEARRTWSCDAASGWVAAWWYHVTVEPGRGSESGPERS
jgi:hypothetical protein